MTSESKPGGTPEPAGAVVPAPDSGDLGHTLIEFARRLANFGLGEVDDPILDDFTPRTSGPQRQP